MRRVAIYARVSTDEQAKVEEGSIKNQAESLTRYINGENLKFDGAWGSLHDTYIDDGYSAKNLNRPAVKRLLLDIYSGKVDTVLFTEISRLSRSVEDWIHLRKFFDEHDSSFVASRQNFDTSTAMGRAMLNFAIEFAQLEREMTAERVKASYQSRAGRGLWTGGPVPFGLEKTDRKGYLEINTAKQIIANEMLDILLEKAGYLAKAVALINEREFKRLDGKPWDEDSFARWIRQRALVGEVEINRKNRKRNQTNLAEADKVKIVPAVWDSLLDKEKWARANDLLDKNHQKLKVEQWKYHDFIMSGLILCPNGKALVGSSGNGRSKEKYAYYIHQPRVHCDCFIKNIPSAEIEKVLIKELKGVLQSPAVIEELAKKANSTFQEARPDYTNEIAACQNKIEGILKKLDKISDQILESKDTHEKEIWTEKLRRVQDEKKIAETEILRLREESKQQHFELLDGTKIREVLGHLMADFESLDKGVKKALLSNILESVQVLKEKIVINVKNPGLPLVLGASPVVLAPAGKIRKNGGSIRNLGGVNLLQNSEHSHNWLRWRDSNPRPSG